MKTKSVWRSLRGSFFPYLFLSLTACSQVKTVDLLRGDSFTECKKTGNVEMREQVLAVSGKDARLFFNKERYKDFNLQMKIRTGNGGKGFVGIHTTDAGGGYQVAINNDKTDDVWWRTTGSLMGIRNLTKHFVRDGEWFTLNVQVTGQRIGVTINDIPAVEYYEPVNPYRIPEKKDQLLSKGGIVLQSTGNGTIEVGEMLLTTIDPKSIQESVPSSEVTEEQWDPIIRLHQEDFPVLDYHVHLKGGLTRQKAAEQSRAKGINYAVAPNCGVGFPITSDAGIYQFLDTMQTEPFILSMQAEGREWQTTFSQEARDSFDYVFTDAMTFFDMKGRRVRLWIPEEVIIDDEEAYMEMIVDRICSVLQEPVDVYVNPFYLPDVMSDRYDQFWTPERVERVIDVLKTSGKALEINELYQIPNKYILMQAKDAGVKFTFGSNNVTPDVSDLSYSLRMKEECNLLPSDMYKPRIKR